MPSIDGYMVMVAALRRANADNDSLRAALAERDEDYQRVVSETCAGDEKHCACVPHLRRRIRELEERVTTLDNDAGRGEPPRPGWVYNDKTSEWEHGERKLWVCFDYDGDGRWAWGEWDEDASGYSESAREGMIVAWDTIAGPSDG